jgi:plasmid stabilization system protein ParE
VQIWLYIKKNASLEMADRDESVIREKIGSLAESPGRGHWRRDLTDEPVKFFPIYAYLIVYRPETRPLQVVAILHGRNMERSQVPPSGFSALFSRPYGKCSAFFRLPTIMWCL